MATSSAPGGKILRLWRRLSTKPGGKWVFTRGVCLKAPYFSTIKPAFEELEPEYARVTIRKRRAVQNHIGTVHAIAMCNMAELAGGLMTEVTVPTTHRWIPKGMTVEYLAKAESDLTAVATPARDLDLSRNSDYLVNIAVTDQANEVVFRAVITMWISAKR